jgi:hypothetical protein
MIINLCFLGIAWMICPASLPVIAVLIVLDEFKDWRDEVKQLLTKSEAKPQPKKEFTESDLRAARIRNAKSRFLESDRRRELQKLLDEEQKRDRQ